LKNNVEKICKIYIIKYIGVIMKKYCILTYGCQMNVHESEKIAGILEGLGFSCVSSPNEADIVVFNTCAIRETAEQKIMGNIGDLKQVKARRKDMIIAVCGCMSQQSGYPEMLREKFPFLDIILGTHNISELGDKICARLNSNKKIVEIKDSENISARDAMPKVRTSGVNAWVNINYGCNNFCTYCIVPYVRGREVSRPKEDILKEVAECVKSGFKQITLLGQNVNSYGNDNREKFGSFAELLKDIDKIPGKFRVRFITSHPKDLSEEVISVIAKSDKICHYLHLPLQSGSDRILKVMNRNYTSAHYLSLIDKAREKISGVEFSSDIIVGFPGESEEDFKKTLEIVKKVGYQQLFTYIYSRRKGTIAATMQEQIPASVKKERIMRLIALEQEMASKISEKFVGGTYEVLIEDVHPKKQGYVIGSLDCGKAITLKGDKNLVGRFVMVKVTGAKLTTLSGEVVDIN